MRTLLVFFGLVALLSSAACVSFEERQKTNAALSRAVDRFHDQLNAGQYHEIYSDADSELHSVGTQVDFEGRLKNAHEQLGVTTSKASAFTQESLWRDLKTTLGVHRQVIEHYELVTSLKVMGSEKFTWAVENNQPKLVSYELRWVCQKPCAIRFG